MIEKVYTTNELCLSAFNNNDIPTLKVGDLVQYDQITDTVHIQTVEDFEIYLGTFYEYEHINKNTTPRSICFYRIEEVKEIE